MRKYICLFCNNFAASTDRSQIYPSDSALHMYFPYYVYTWLQVYHLRITMLSIQLAQTDIGRPIRAVYT